MKKIFGQKIGMISSFLENGKMVPVTIVHIEPNLVIENKTLEKHGYIATKVAFNDVDEKKLLKPELGVFKKQGFEAKKNIRELKGISNYQVGDKISLDIFNAGEHVDVQAITKGHGFTGAIKRWNFKCGPKTHGAGYPHRYQGSISFGRGGSQGQRVVKGKKMAGRYGCELVTIQNLEILDIDTQNNVMLIKGAIPGAKKALVQIKSTIKKPKNKLHVKIINNTDKKENLVNNTVANSEVNGG